MLYVLAEPVYKDSIWCNEILNGIRSKAKEKRVQVCFADDISNIAESGQLILVATTLGWVKEKINECNVLPVKTVVVTPKIPVNEKISCSFVGSDSEGAVINVISLLRKKGKKHLALYGVNSDSVNDLCKKNCFLSCSGKEVDVFYNNGDINSCFNALYERVDSFDAVLCTNSYAAFHLVNALKNKGDALSRLFIISLSDSRLLQFSSPSVTAVGIDYKELGKAAFEACRVLRKNNSLTAVNMAVEWKICERQTTAGLADLGELASEETLGSEKIPGAAPFYSDGEIAGLMAVENLLETCDATDLKLISLLQKEATYERISKELFISESGIKYRIKKMLTAAGVHSREELIEFLSRQSII